MEKTNTQQGPCALIAAVGRHGELGRGGNLIWPIRADLRRFRRLTMGHPVIMGRKTWESLPGGALPGRRNIVVSRQAGYRADGAETAQGLEEALALCAGGPMPFIIGGGELYRRAYSLVSHLYLTHIDAECADADTWLPLPDAAEWRVTADETSGEGETPAYRFTDYVRVTQS
ncbi:MAG: dihydrofolate reductase [Muribaculaceae bacterium]|nr:dihydrofolate reductase [Muribaculaceae bacterium]MDE7188799.1 dihydrofolate reductase [Muribaculaceae bacterium]